MSAFCSPCGRTSVGKGDVSPLKYHKDRNRKKIYGQDTSRTTHRAIRHGQKDNLSAGADKRHFLTRRYPARINFSTTWQEVNKILDSYNKALEIIKKSDKRLPRLSSASDTLISIAQDIQNNFPYRNEFSIMADSTGDLHLFANIDVLNNSHVVWALSTEWVENMPKWSSDFKKLVCRVLVTFGRNNGFMSNSDMEDYFSCEMEMLSENNETEDVPEFLLDPLSTTNELYETDKTPLTADEILSFVPSLAETKTWELLKDNIDCILDKQYCIADADVMDDSDAPIYEAFLLLSNYGDEIIDYWLTRLNDYGCDYEFRLVVPLEITRETPVDYKTDQLKMLEKKLKFTTELCTLLQI